MRLAVITPVGPGHEQIVADRAARSVRMAIKAAPDGPFDVRHVIVPDPLGRGRSKARNEGMSADADWFFFLDADDCLRPDALKLNDFDSPATFGAVLLNGRMHERNVFPCGWPEIAKHGATGTLSMGFFCRADVARAIRFNETRDTGEDFDFYMRLPAFTKIEKPLVDIGYHIPSATGPRGYLKIDWVGICNKVVDEAVQSDPAKFGFGGDAVLAPVGSAPPQPRAVSRPL